jgi:hypothetical protein
VPWTRWKPRAEALQAPAAPAEDVTRTPEQRRIAELERKIGEQETNRKGGMNHRLPDLGALEICHAEAIRLVEGGKRVGDAVYLHEALLATLSAIVQPPPAAAHPSSSASAARLIRGLN